MEFLFSDGPIIACSTNSEKNSAIAVIRLSGFSNLDFLSDFIDLKISTIKTRYAHFCKLVHNKEVLDEIVLTYFKAPNSYNGENIIELSVHGNILNIERIIRLFIDHSIFRHAFPGEFSYRALKNKKLTFSQVEGLDLLLNANSSFILNQGFSLLNGKLQTAYLELNTNFLAHKSAVELSIDFLDDIGEQNANVQFNETLDRLYASVKKLHNQTQNRGNNLINPEITLVGLPNSGKSSLFNLILDDDRAIVSDVAGTTRDYISENIKIGDVICRLIDTAGVRDTSDQIESEGIKKSLELVANSFFKILLINPFEFNINYFKDLSKINFDLVIFSHSDIKDFNETSLNLLNELNKLGFALNGPIEPADSGPMGANKNGPIEPTSIGPIGANLLVDSKSVNNLIESLINKKYGELIKDTPIAVDRHFDVINNIYSLLSDYNTLCQIETDISIISSELNGIGHCISELIGIVSPNDVLHNIFNNFCIGK